MDSIAIDPARIRWIAFDAVDTLIRPTPSVAAIYHEVGVRHGSGLALDQVGPRFRQAFSRTEEDGVLECSCPEAHEKWHTCETRERLRWRTIVETVLSDARCRDECFEELFEHFAQPSSWSCFPDVESALLAVRQLGFRLAVSSNFDARLHSVMDGLPTLGPIELRVVSSEVGFRKPSHQFFQSLLRRAGCDPRELVFIGDNLVTDVAAANAAGIPALRIDRAAPREETGVVRSLNEIIDLLGGGPKSKVRSPNTGSQKTRRL